MKTQLLALILIFNLVGFALYSADPASTLPALDLQDITALLDASYSKVRVVGIPDQEIAIFIKGNTGKTIKTSEVLKIGPSGMGDLCVCARNAEGITGHQRKTRLTYTWSTPPFSLKGRFEFDKFWNYRKGSTFSDYSDESFDTRLTIWKVASESKCRITSIWWCPRKISSVDAEGNAEKMGEVVLEKHTTGERAKVDKQ